MRTQINEENFQEIYEKTYHTTLKFIIIKCHNIDDVNDIIQDTYLELLLLVNKRKILEIDNVQNYIWGVANNIIKRHYHKKKDNVMCYPKEEEIAIEIVDTFDVEQRIITKDNVEKVWKYVKDKDLLTAKIFYLYFSLGLKISEIAQALNLKEPNIKNRIYRTLKELKKFLGKDVIKND